MIWPKYNNVTHLDFPEIARDFLSKTLPKLGPFLVVFSVGNKAGSPGSLLEYHLDRSICVLEFAK